jgi:hypothetical protein
MRDGAAEGIWTANLHKASGVAPISQSEEESVEEKESQCVQHA